MYDTRNFQLTLVLIKPRSSSYIIPSNITLVLWTEIIAMYFTQNLLMLKLPHFLHSPVLRKEACRPLVLQLTASAPKATNPTAACTILRIISIEILLPILCACPHTKYNAHEQSTPDPALETEEMDDPYCKICCTGFSSLSKLCRHYTTRKHRMRYMSLLECCGSEVKSLTPMLQICSCQFAEG